MADFAQAAAVSRALNSEISIYIVAVEQFRCRNRLYHYSASHNQGALSVGIVLASLRL